MIAQYVKLSMIPSGVMPTLYVSQYDVGRPLGLIVTNGTELVNMDSYSVTIEATRSDGTQITTAVTTADNIGTFQTTATMTNVAGIYKAQLVIAIASGKRIASIPFLMNVTAAAMDENGQGIAEDQSLYQQYTGTVQTLIATIRADLNTEIANRQSAVSAEAAARQTADNTLQSNINSEASTRAAADQNLQAQISQIVAPSGEAPSAAEVQNARVGADGVTYPTLGDAIRANDSQLKSQFNVSLYDAAVTLNLTDGEYVQSTTGEIIADASYARTQYIEAARAEGIRLAWTSSTQRGTLNALCCYDANKAYISGRMSPINPELESKDYTLPANTAYVIFSGDRRFIGNISATLLSVVSPMREIYLAKADKKAAFLIDYVTDVALLEKINGVTAKPGNLVDYSECIDNYYISTSTGSTTYGTNYFHTGYIPVTAGTQYKANKGRNYAWYDATKTYISGDIGTAIQSGITAPENAAYIRYTINKTTDGTDSPLDLYFTDTTQYNNTVQIDNLKIPEEYIYHPWCYGKSINWIGDSIVDGPDFDEEVCAALNLTKLTTDGTGGDGGINGSTIALKADGTDARNALCIRYSAMPNNADIIAVSCGTNDFEYAWCPIGTIDDPDDGTSNTTFYGALKTLCKGLIDKYPQKVIFFTTPIKRGQAFANGDGGEYTADGVPTTPFSKNKYGKTLMDYADIIKEVCGYYSIPVLDMYRESLLNPHLASQQSMFDNVLTHPNVAGQRIMARRVCGWLTQLGYTISGLS